MGAIYIMWLRQIKRYWRSKARVIGSLAQPLLFLIALGFGFGPVFQKAGGGNYLEFLVPGIVGMSILFTAMFNGIEVIWDRQFGFLKETLVAPVSRFKIMIGKTIGGATVASIQGVIVLLISFLIGYRTSNWFMIPIAFAFMFLTAMFFTAMGIAIASRMRDMQGFQLIMNFVIMPIFFLSGALFPLDSLPSALKIITYINPLSYGIEGIRNSITTLNPAGIILDFVVLTIITLIVTLIGSWMFSKTEA